MSDQRVDPETVREKAVLARLDLDDEEVEQFAAQCAEILESFETLDEVPEIEAEPDLVNVMRTDEVGDCLDRDTALANAAETEDGHFKGPNVS